VLQASRIFGEKKGALLINPPIMGWGGRSILSFSLRIERGKARQLSEVEKREGGPSFGVPHADHWGEEKEECRTRLLLMARGPKKKKRVPHHLSSRGSRAKKFSPRRRSSPRWCGKKKRRKKEPRRCRCLVEKPKALEEAARGP